jgi:hypothetical protein
MFRSDARRRRARSSECVRFALALALVFASSACEPKLVVGAWNCPAPSRTADADGGMLVPVTDPIAVPWSTGFETGLCDWDRAQGFCYGDPGATFGVVSAPAHTGTKALSFTVTPSDTSGRQARCVREGTLPAEAIYGAWFYVPELATNTGNWNLMHFQGGEPGSSISGWWDVSLGNDADSGKLVTQVLDYVGQAPLRPQIYKGREIEVGQWVHLEFRWRRATDATGEVELRQDGQQVVLKENIATDDADWGQWYVGNLATALDQPDSTVYVDDVSIRAP